MGFIFDFFGNISGYLLWFFFDAVSNYAVAITLFALVINLVMLPFTIKRQKNMALTSRLSAKDAELRKKYEKNPRKYNEERALLYEKEGVDPMAGCFTTMILPLLIWGGVFGAIARPLHNTLHIPQDKVTSIVSTLKEEGKIKPPYEELQIVRHFENLKGFLGEKLSKEEFADVEEYSTGFNFCGINLLGNPSGSDFKEMLWIIPLLCFASSAAGIFISQKINGMENQAQGCAKFMPYGAVLLTTYVAYTMPAAVGFYWFINGVIGSVVNVIIGKYWNIHTINAKSEAARISMLEAKEAKVISVKEEKINV